MSKFPLPRVALNLERPVNNHLHINGFVEFSRAKINVDLCQNLIFGAFDLFLLNKVFFSL